MESTINLLYDSQSASTAYQIGPGDEFCVGTPSGCELATTSRNATFASSTLIPQSGTILALYGDVSAGDLAAGSGKWDTVHAFYVNPGCTQFGTPPNGFAYYGPGNYFASIPANSVNLLTTIVAGSLRDLQTLVDQPLYVYVNQGDCLVHLITVNALSAVDAETQIHALIQPGASLLQPPPNPGYTTQPMYRFYNPTTSEHFFTATLQEGLHAPSFRYEGIGFNFLAGAGMPGTIPIYRCYNGSKHFISLDPNCEGTRLEGTYGSLYSNEVAGTRPIYRTYNFQLGDHLETPNINESFANTYSLEFILGYGQ